MDLLDILSSAVVTVLVVVLIALRRTDRKIPIEDIPQERAKCEEKVRGKSRSALTRRPLAPSIPEPYVPRESATVAEAPSEPGDKT